MTETAAHGDARSNAHDLERQFWLSVIRDCFGTDTPPLETVAREYLLSQGFALRADDLSWRCPPHYTADLGAIPSKEYACISYLRAIHGYGGLSAA